MSKLLSAPKYFKLKETAPGTVLVHRGRLQKEDISQKYGNRQFYFYDEEDRKLKCLSGGSLNYIMDLYEIDKTKEVKITYMGMDTVENGKFAGNEAHQFEMELVGEDDEAPVTETAEAPAENTNSSLDDLE